MASSTSLSLSNHTAKRSVEEFYSRGTSMDAAICRRLMAISSALQLDFNTLDATRFAPAVWQNLVWKKSITEVKIVAKTFFFRLPTAIFTYFKNQANGSKNLVINDDTKERLANGVWLRAGQGAFADLKCTSYEGATHSTVQFTLPHVIYEYQTRTHCDYIETTQKLIEYIQGRLQAFIHPDFLQDYLDNGNAKPFLYKVNAEATIQLNQTVQVVSTVTPNVQQPKRQRVASKEVLLSPPRRSKEDLFNICQRIHLFSRLLSGEIGQQHERWFYVRSWSRLMERLRAKRLVRMISCDESRFKLKVDTAFLHYHIVGAKLGYGVEESSNELKWIAESHPKGELLVSEFLQNSHKEFGEIKSAVDGPNYLTVSVTLPFLPKSKLTLDQIASTYRRILEGYLNEELLAKIEQQGFHSVAELRTNYIPFSVCVKNALVVEL